MSTQGTSKRKPDEQQELEVDQEFDERQKGKQRKVAEERLIWFQLVDATSGKPFKDTVVTSILSSSLKYPIIDYFVRSVKDEDKKDESLLTSIAATQLRVYKNQASFDKRNAAVEDGKENSSSPLEGLGSSKREALIVAVPQGIFL